MKHDFEEHETMMKHDAVFGVERKYLQIINSYTVHMIHTKLQCMGWLDTSVMLGYFAIHYYNWFKNAKVKYNLPFENLR